MTNLFTKHPHHIGETYLSHLWFAAKTCFVLLGIALMFLIHAIFPFLLVSNGSRSLSWLAQHCSNRRECVENTQNKPEQEP